MLAVYAEVRLPRPQPGLVRSEVPGLAQALTWIASGIVGNAAWHLVLKYLRDQGRSEEQPAVSPLRVDDAVAFGRQYSISIGGERSDEDLMLRSVSRERVDGEWVWCCVLETPVQTFRIVMLDLGQGIPVLRDFEIVNRIEVGEEWDPPAGG